MAKKWDNRQNKIEFGKKIQVKKEIPAKFREEIKAELIEEIEQTRVELEKERKKASKANYLEEKFCEIGSDRNEATLRIHRAISWIKASETHAENDDIRFICFWISFNSCYAIDNYFNTETANYEKNSIDNFLNKIVSLDHNQKICSLICEQFAPEVQLIIQNEFLFRPYWEYQRNNYHTHYYEQPLAREITETNNSLEKGDVVKVLEIVLSRLSVLRNQLFHGGATYKGSVNRQQVKEATLLLKELVPTVIEIMIENQEKEWDTPYYPVINAHLI